MYTRRVLICSTHPGANLHPGAFSLNTVYMTKIHPRCKVTLRVYICTGVYIVHINEALDELAQPRSLVRTVSAYQIGTLVKASTWSFIA